eukprot:m.90470 g.90470  ORF g.90470 m.90470 type:complete len:326 (+) comp8465_c0_seq2:2665-3642(+)
MCSTRLELCLGNGVRREQSADVDEALLQHGRHLDGARGAVDLEVRDADVDRVVLDVVRQAVAVGHHGAEGGEVVDGHGNRAGRQIPVARALEDGIREERMRRHLQLGRNEAQAQHVAVDAAALHGLARVVAVRSNRAPAELRARGRVALRAVHRPHEGGGLGRGRSNGFRAAVAEHARVTGFVGPTRLAVQAVVRQLKGDLEKRIWADAERFDLVLAKAKKLQRVDTESINELVERTLGNIDLAGDGGCQGPGQQGRLGNRGRRRRLMGVTLVRDGSFHHVAAHDGVESRVLEEHAALAVAADDDLHLVKPPVVASPASTQAVQR